MATIPGDVASGRIGSAAHMNGVLDLFRFWLDERPLFKDGAGVSATVDSGDVTVFGPSGFGTQINIGGFTVGDDERFGVNGSLAVPIGGDYLFGCTCTWPSDPSGSRRLLLLRNGSPIAGAGDRRGATGSSSETWQSAVTVSSMAVGNTFSVQVLQTSGSGLTPTLSMFAVYLGS